MIRKTIIHVAFPVLIVNICTFFFWSFPCFGGVIFETTFDSNSDWNTTGIYEGKECSVIGKSNSANICSPNNYPTNWEAFRTMPVQSGLPPTVQIGRLPNSLADHSGTGTGKAMIVYNESKTSGGVPWPGDGILVKYFGGITYPEIYVRFHMRVQPNWVWAADGGWGGTAYPQIKWFRTGYWPGLSSSQQNIFYIPDTHPQQFVDLAHPVTDGLMNAYRCDPNDYYCSNQNNSYQKNDSQFKTATWADGNWHSFLLHLKLNTAGSYNGIMEIWQDNTLVYQKTDVMWKESGSTAPGFTHVMLGGNANNPFASLGSQWYAIDDVIISTNSIPINYVIGGGVAGPGAPEGPGGTRTKTP